MQSINTQLGCKIKALRTDNGAKFLSHNLQDFIPQHGCVHLTSCVYNRRQNGVVAHRHKNLLETIRSLKFHSATPDRFWGDYVLTTTCIINMLPYIVLRNRRHFEVLFKQKPIYEHMRVFDYLCYVTNTSPQKSKFEPKVRACVFLGYPFRKEGYKMMDLTSHSVFVSLDVTILEDKFPFKGLDTEKEKSNNVDVFPAYYLFSRILWIINQVMLSPICPFQVIFILIMMSFNLSAPVDQPKSGNTSFCRRSVRVSKPP